MRKQLWIMVGVPGSGKNYWIDTHKDSFNGSVKIVSRDEIRFSLVKEDEEYFSKEKEVYNNFIKEICEGLCKYDITIANATHLNAGARAKLFKQVSWYINSCDVEVNAMVIKRDLNTCLAQNNQRKGRELVPESAIRNMYSSLTIPAIEEGFDNIYINKGKINDKSHYEVIKKG